MAIGLASGLTGADTALKKTDMPLRKTFWQVERFIVHRVLHADDTPHRLALGIALGFFIAWTPTMGLQMILVVLAATLCRANRVVGLPIVWISNPLTAVPIYFANYTLGRLLVGLFSERPIKTYEQIKSIVGDLIRPGRHIFEAQFWRGISDALLEMSVELWLGSVIVGLLVGVVSYVISYHGIVWYRTHSPLFHRRRRLLRRKDENERQRRSSSKTDTGEGREHS